MRTVSRGEIVTDARQRTGNPRFWAAGDATGGPPYVYTAAAQGSVAAANELFAGGTNTPILRSTGEIALQQGQNWSIRPGGRPPGLAHSEQEVDYTALPRVTFTSPAIASAGLTQAELVSSGVACDCRVLPLKAVPARS